MSCLPLYRDKKHETVRLIHMVSYIIAVTGFSRQIFVIRHVSMDTTMLLWERHHALTNFHGLSMWRCCGLVTRSIRSFALTATTGSVPLWQFGSSPILAQHIIVHLPMKLGSSVYSATSKTNHWPYLRSLVITRIHLYSQSKNFWILSHPSPGNVTPL